MTRNNKRATARSLGESVVRTIKSSQDGYGFIFSDKLEDWGVMGSTLLQKRRTTYKEEWQKTKSKRAETTTKAQNNKRAYHKKMG